MTPGGTCVLIGTYAVTQEDMDACVVNNTATASAVDPQDVPVLSNPALAVVAGNCPRDLTIIKEGPESFGAVNEVLSYTITVTNTGKVTLSNVTITDAKLTPSTVTCDTLAPGGICVLVGTYTVTQEDMDVCVVNNTATVTGVGPDGATLTAEASKTVPGDTCDADIDLVKTATPQTYAAVGDTITYTFTVTNTGRTTLTDIVVTDPLVTVSGGPLASLAPGASDSVTFTATYTVTQADLDAGTFTNTATATGKGPKGNMVSDEDSETETCSGCGPVLAIDKNAVLINGTPSESYADGDDNFQYDLDYDFVDDSYPAIFNLAVDRPSSIIYEIVITNTGNVTLDKIEVKDPLIALDTTIESLAPSESRIFNGVFTLPYTDADIPQTTEDPRDIDIPATVNTATVTGTDPQGNPVSAEAEATVILGPICCEGINPAELLWGLLTLIPLYIISLFNGGEIITPINHP